MLLGDYGCNGLLNILRIGVFGVAHGPPDMDAGSAYAGTLAAMHNKYMFPLLKKIQSGF